MINEKKIEGISYINDESDRNGLRIIIILKHDAVASVVLNTLFKNDAAADFVCSEQYRAGRTAVPRCCRPARSGQAISSITATT